MDSLSTSPKSDIWIPVPQPTVVGDTLSARRPTKQKGIVVFSGGSAANSLVDVFRGMVEDNKCQLSYIIPISDNGGSSSELIRVFGGPGKENIS
jgi:hypothetical protein